jgi:hypothetical protein
MKGLLIFNYEEKMPKIFKILIVSLLLSVQSLSFAQDLSTTTFAGNDNAAATEKILASELHQLLATLPNGLKVARIRSGAQPNLVAIIGRKMVGVVNLAADHLEKNGVKVETFQWTDEARDQFYKAAKEYQRATGNDRARLPYDEVKKTLAYEMNQEWAEHLVQDGYTIVDMGDPSGADAVEGASAFYDIEKTVIFPELAVSNSVKM